MKHFLVVLIILLGISTLKAQLKTSFLSDFSKNESLNITVADAKSLLVEYAKELNEEVSLNILFRLNKNITIDTSEYPPHNYTQTYSFNLKNKEANLVIESPSQQGLVFGLYNFLQEKLGILFYHPKNTYIPSPKRWNLTSAFINTVNPRFTYKGFHIHTQHPLELTEYLMEDEWGEKGQEEVKQYFDWLVRNGQNYFQFFLLESIKTKKWIPYFKPIADYGRKRGISLGLNVTLHMIQQKAYTLYKNWPISWLPRKKQISNRIEKLNQIKWDYWTIDFKTHEFTKDKSKRIDRLKFHIYDELKKYGVKIGEHYHVPNRPDHLEDNLEGKEKEFVENSAGFIHTVMFYTVTDEKAPVYENDNLKHMMKKLTNSIDNDRETWYFPESAYWVTFDNSVPMLLTPYLNARLTDIKTMDSLGINGHMTFSSGWEWGYWLIDWSIARWSWKSEYETPKPYDLLEKATKRKSTYYKLEELSNLQQEYIKDSNLIQWLTAQTVTDEAPEWIFNKEFHPRPPFSYKHLRNKSTKEEIAYAQQAIKILHQFVYKSEKILATIDNKYDDPILQELVDGYTITTLRAKHRGYILEYLITKRMQQKRLDETKLQLEEIMKNAQNTRLEAQEIVNRRIKEYRYPNIIIGNKYKGKTAYGFGYLYTVKELHFWKREEEQAKRNKYKVRFMNIYNLMRIGGLIN